jgi:hypothetical protein
MMLALTDVQAAEDADVEGPVHVLPSGRSETFFPASPAASASRHPRYK